MFANLILIFYYFINLLSSEDLKRYQRVILQNLGYKDQDINTVSDDMKQKCKTYGNQAADRILRPDQVFRGFLVSTLTCQECFNVSSRHEYFLDLSLPVSVEKSPPPQLRRKPSPDNVASYYLQSAPISSLYAATNTTAATAIGTSAILTTSTTSINNNADQSPTKSTLKKDQKKDRRIRLGNKQFQGNNSRNRDFYDNAGTGAVGDASTPNFSQESESHEEDGPISAISSGSSSSVEQSDADVEDNLMEEGDKAFNGNNFNTNHLKCKTNINSNIDTNSNNSNFDSNGNDNNKSSQQKLFSPVEKCDESPENIDKDSLDEDENGSKNTINFITAA